MDKENKGKCGGYIRTPEIRKRHSEISKALWAEGKFPRTHSVSDETRAKQSESKKLLARNGWHPWNYGKKLNYSPERWKLLRENLSKSWEKKRKYYPGDRFIMPSREYVCIYDPSHPSANSTGYVHEHRVVAERAMGRRLKRNEVVHHIDGDKANNRNDNLLICSVKYHSWLHARMCLIYQYVMFNREDKPWQPSLSF